MKHATVIANIAIDFMRTSQNFKFTELNGKKLGMKIGISTGMTDSSYANYLNG